MKNHLSCLAGFVSAITLSLCIADASRAADYLGAAGVIRSTEENHAKPPPEPATNEMAILRAELKAFQTNSTGLAPAVAAKRWLDFVDRTGKTQSSPQMRYRRITGGTGVKPVSAFELLGALPSPAAWDELGKMIMARPASDATNNLREIGLRLLATTLTDDAAGRKSVISALQAKSTSSGNEVDSYYSRTIFEQLTKANLAAADDAEQMLSSLERQLNSKREEYQGALEIPNLVPLVGKEKAEAFLRQALMRRVPIGFDANNETSRLAQKLALEMIDKLKVPQWKLVNSLDAIDLYEALEKKFENGDAGETNNSGAGLMSLLRSALSGQSPDPGMSLGDSGSSFGERDKSEAKLYYLLGLIAHDRAKDAVTVAKSLGKGGNDVYLPSEAFGAMEQAGYTKALESFFYELLSQEPGLSFWGQYVQIAAKAGQTDRMLELARKTVAREDLPASKKKFVRETFFRALLAGDQVEEGVAEMRRTMTNTSTSTSDSPGQRGIVLAKIGMLAGHPEWADEGIQIARKWLESPEGGAVWNSDEITDALVLMLFELKRGPEAEELLAKKLAEKSGSEERYYHGSGGNKRSALANLAVLYHRSGRKADVLTLLDQAPWWNAKDLKDLMSTTVGDDAVALTWIHTTLFSWRLPYVAGVALNDASRKQEAMKIANALLDHYPGSDRGYELLLATGETNITARLDELFARDQFEERPLIWKAHVLREQGHLEAAEKVARQAVAIDPSDGEEGPGDRMRVYAELAEIRDAQGDKKEAEFFRGVVKSIRMSEQADQFYMAGLLKRAVKMYEEALNSFADAYCIQSRLAIQLSALGMNEAAEEHYRRAYELMPDSFGRVESHCFGCERAFADEHAQGIAEKVFSKLAQERPDKPQVHYLLGYLHTEQEQFELARTNFQTAVRLDPDYLNAWVKLNGLDSHVHLSANERDAIVLNILRLDPLRRHASVYLDRMKDLRALWNAVVAGTKFLPAPTPALLPLTASKAALEKVKTEATDESEDSDEMNYRYAGGDFSTPAEAIAQTPFIKIAGQLLGKNDGESDPEMRMIY